MILVWLLATAGSSLILTQSSIIAPLRDRLARLAGDPRRCEHETGGVRCRLSTHTHGPHRMSLAAHPERWRARIASAASKLANCPMCSGFWLGLAWSTILGWRGVMILALGPGGSVASALAVAAWILLQEAHQAVALWRYNNPPKDS